jgi:EamA domain-containing membrane protein RarD
MFEMCLSVRYKIDEDYPLGNRLTLYALGLLKDGNFAVYELASAVMPFSFIGLSQYVAILHMMAVFHVCFYYLKYDYCCSFCLYYIFKPG